jgi:HlyD family secretion protein
MQKIRDNLRRRRRLWIALALAGAAALAWQGARRAARAGAPDPGPLHVVGEGPLTISVVSAGTVQSSQNAVIRSEVEGRNTILWVIEEGKSVTNGQLLIEIDASTFVDKLTDQQILVANADAALTQADEKLAIARNEQEASVAEAELKLHLARLDQEKYARGEYPQLLQEANSKIGLAREELERAMENLNWSRRLSEEGYLTRSELQADELALKQKQSSLDAAVTSLSVLTNYTSRQQQATLASNLRQSELALDRVTRQTRADLIQAESDARAKKLEADRQRARLEKLEKMIAACSIRAPTEGVVIYASTIQASQRRWGSDPLQAGVQVVERQELIQIPLNGGMSVTMSVPESNLAKLREGQLARIRIEAQPGREFSGRLSKVGLLPDGRNAWLNPDLKLYNCVVDIEAVNELRAGMNCEVEVMVEQHRRVIAIPVQCVLHVGETPTVFIWRQGEIVKQPIKVGFDNNRLVHVLEGLHPGDQVLLNPPFEAGSVRDDKAGQDVEMADASRRPDSAEAPGPAKTEARAGGAGNDLPGAAPGESAARPAAPRRRPAGGARQQAAGGERSP